MMNEKSNTAIADLVLGKLPPDEASRLLDAIARDPELSSVLEMTIELQSFSQRNGKRIYEDRLVPVRSLRKSTGLPLRRANAALAWRGRIVPIALLISFVLLCLVSRSWMNGRDTLYDPGTEWISWASHRSTAYTDLVYAEMLVRTGEYKNAHRVLMRHMRSHPKDVLRGQVQYNAAVLTLFLARKEVFGIWVFNNPLEVEAGVQLLDSVVLGHNSVALRNRASYLRAKALVAIGDDLQAIDELVGLSIRDPEYKKSADALMSKVRGK
jgi:hypothetical protein